MNAFEKALKRKIAHEVPNLASVTPGIVFDVHVRGRRKGSLRVGTTYDFYDLASLTKIIFSASACMHYFADHPRELKSPVHAQVPWWNARTSPFDLLTHSAGLDWWRPYYKYLKGPMQPQLRWDQLKRKLSRTKPSRGPHKAVYSDLDLWLLGSFMEAASEMSLLDLWGETASRLGIKDLHFHPRNKPLFTRSRYAPTERCTWRKKILRGEVHDENTWALAGVSPNAGLFGSIEAVSDWAMKLRASVVKGSAQHFDPETARKFTRRQIPSQQGDWGLGFMKPTLGRASCGKYFSPRSFGHTGFTGTSIWIDPTKDIVIVILSNRVHPTRHNPAFAALRPRLHEWICELL